MWPAQKAALVVTVLAALGYGRIAGMQIPALRTVAMLVVAALALWSGRATPLSVVLAWAAGIAVAIDPWAVMSPGFWLSFGAVAVIFLHARDPEDQQAAHGTRGERGRMARLRAGVVDAARTQWAVTIGLVPLTLLLFGQVSLVSCVANAVAIPVVSLLVTPMALAGGARCRRRLPHRCWPWRTPCWAGW
ncbi:ComEC/Rec2 family competence protein [Cupriavidus pauculus]|uniref:ComEC/Rec2 family competence protein n=1 Tax=Cupriavidus pauculus TaxID=82633 RepID=UPI0021551629|nr:ComEC/Rec2 family competence protein [Cupriavidus pauculus]